MTDTIKLLQKGQSILASVRRDATCPDRIDNLLRARILLETAKHQIDIRIAETNGYISTLLVLNDDKGTTS